MTEAWENVDLLHRNHKAAFSFGKLKKLSWIKVIFEQNSGFQRFVGEGRGGVELMSYALPFYATFVFSLRYFACPWFLRWRWPSEKQIWNNAKNVFPRTRTWPSENMVSCPQTARQVLSGWPFFDLCLHIKTL